MTDGGLREAEVFGDGGGAAAAQQATEDQQQAAIEAPDIIGVDIAHERNSVSEFGARA